MINSTQEARAQLVKLLCLSKIDLRNCSNLLTIRGEMEERVGGGLI